MIMGGPKIPGKLTNCFLQGKLVLLIVAETEKRGTEKGNQ